MKKENRRWEKAQEAERKFWIKRRMDPDQLAQKRADFWLKNFIEPFSLLERFEKIHIVVDIGCGPTGLINHVNGDISVGIDPLIKEYEKFYNLPRHVTFIEAIGENLPLRDESADCVICINALDHSRKPQAILGEIRRITRKRGLLIFQINTDPMANLFVQTSREHSVVLARTFKKGAQQVYNWVLEKYDVHHPYHWTLWEVVKFLNDFQFRITRTIYEEPTHLNMRYRILRRVFRSKIFACGIKVMAQKG